MLHNQLNYSEPQTQWDNQTIYGLNVNQYDIDDLFKKKEGMIWIVPIYV